MNVKGVAHKQLTREFAAVVYWRFAV